MGTFDRDEQNIYEALSRITVDVNGLEEKVKNQLNKNTRRAAPRRVRWAVAAAVAMMAVLTVTVSVAALGNFDWFIRKINPAFGEIIEPVEAWCEDKGIRMDVIGAQKYGNMAVVYLSLQDISGENRLTEQTDFRDGFSVKMNAAEARGQAGETGVVAGMSWKKTLLYFDELSNTAYYEFNITADASSPMADPLTLGSFLIYFNQEKFEYAPVSLALSELEETEAISLQRNYVWGGSNDPDDFGGLTGALVPDYYGEMPHGRDDQWISNAGIVNGKLHIQVGGIWNKEFGSSDANLYIKAPNGEMIECDYSLRLLTDGNYRLLNLTDDDYSDAVYKFDNFVFSAESTELEGYTLCYMGSVSSGVEGSWRVTANLSDSSRQTRFWKNDIYVEGYLFEYLTLTPLGLQAIGSYGGDECDISVSVETANGVIPLEGGGGSYDGNVFNMYWKTEAPLDVSAATAVVVNGVRIPVK